MTIANRLINDVGRQYVTDFVTKFGKKGLIAAAYFSDAEEEAVLFDSNEQPVLEIASFYAADNKSHQLPLKPEWFDSGKSG